MGALPKNGGGRKTQTMSLDDATVDALAQKISPKSPKTRRTKNEWRSLFALILLGGFLVIIGFIVVYDQVWGTHTNASEILSTVGNLINSPLSFVIGYYYSKERTNTR